MEILISRYYPALYKVAPACMRKAEAPKDPGLNRAVSRLDARASTNHSPPHARTVLTEDFLGSQHRPQTLQNAHLLPPSKIDTFNITNRLYALRT